MSFFLFFFVGQNGGASNRVLIMEERMLATGSNTAPIHTSEENAKTNLFFSSKPPVRGV